jgi:hypothetical protein
MAPSRLASPPVGPDNRRRDADNLCILLDLVTRHQVMEEDSKLMRITAGWDRSVLGGRAIVIVKSAVEEIHIVGGKTGLSLKAPPPAFGTAL